MTEQQRQQIEYVRQLKQKGAALMTQQIETSGDVPAELGIFGGSSFPAFEFGRAYQQYEPFSLNGIPGYVKQPHTSQEQWVPFTAGTEALYGARPKMKADGTYDYTYNMAAEVGMKVWGTDGKLYNCIQGISDMLYPPEAIPAHFELA